MSCSLDRGTCARLLSLGLLLASGACSAGTTPSAPTSPAEALKAFDLETFPLAEGADQPSRRSVAGLSYNAPGAVKELFEKQRGELAKRGWSEQSGSYVSDESASATFARGGYTLSLAVMPSGEMGKANIMLINHGNVQPAGLPVPEGAKSFYAGPVNAMFLTEAPADATKEACRKLLVAKGWQPYGSAGDTQFFKQNGVRLSVTVGAAAAQGGKTMIDFSTQMMSVDLPAPPDAVGLQYSEGQLFFDSPATAGEVDAYYRQTLGKAGWEATTEKPVKIDFKDVVIFRNPAKELIEVELTEVDGKQRVLVRHKSAAEVAALDQWVKAEIERRNKEKDKPLPKLAIELPSGASEIEQTKARIEFKLASGQASSAVEAWRKKFAADGWQEEAAVLDKAAGSITFTKEGQALSVTYIDPTIVPAEITLQATGMELTHEAQ
jgi:hypothetical protein